MRLLLASLTLASLLPFGMADTVRTVRLRGREEKLRIYGTQRGQPVILASGDGGWMHLAPHLATALAARGYFVIGLDSREYLSGAAGSTRALAPGDVAGD